MADKGLAYLYPSGRAHALHSTVLTQETLERMAEADSRHGALRTLTEGGLALAAEESAAAALEAQKAELFSSLSASGAGKEIVTLFRIPYDSHNAKVLLKARLTGASAEGLLSPCGSVPAEQMRHAVQEQGGAALPPWLEQGLRRAKQVWTDSRSPQLIDVALDRSCFAGMLETARQSGTSAAEDYVRLCIDGINLQTVLRMKNAAAEAVEEMLLPGGNSGIARILEGRAGGNLAAAFSHPALRAAAESGQADAGARALAALLAALAARWRRIPFGAETLLGFLLGLELRQAAARMILASKEHPGAADKEAWEVLYG